MEGNRMESRGMNKGRGLWVIEREMIRLGGS